MQQFTKQVLSMPHILTSTTSKLWLPCILYSVSGNTTEKYKLYNHQSELWNIHRLKTEPRAKCYSRHAGIMLCKSWQLSWTYHSYASKHAIQPQLWHHLQLLHQRAVSTAQTPGTTALPQMSPCLSNPEQVCGCLAPPAHLTPSPSTLHQPHHCCCCWKQSCQCHWHFGWYWTGRHVRSWPVSRLRYCRALWKALAAWRRNQGWWRQRRAGRRCWCGWSCQWRRRRQWPWRPRPSCGSPSGPSVW